MRQLAKKWIDWVLSIATYYDLSIPENVYGIYTVEKLKSLLNLNGEMMRAKNQFR
jgi:hypothetical protein